MKWCFSTVRQLAQSSCIRHLWNHLPPSLRQSSVYLLWHPSQLLCTWAFSFYRKSQTVSSGCKLYLVGRSIFLQTNDSSDKVSRAWAGTLSLNLLMFLALFEKAPCRRSRDRCRVCAFGWRMKEKKVNWELKNHTTPPRDILVIDNKKFFRSSFLFRFGTSGGFLSTPQWFAVVSLSFILFFRFRTSRRVRTKNHFRFESVDCACGHMASPQFLVAFVHSFAVFCSFYRLSQLFDSPITTRASFQLGGLHTRNIPGPVLVLSYDC